MIFPFNPTSADPTAWEVLLDLTNEKQHPARPLDYALQGRWQGQPGRPCSIELLLH